MMCVHEMKVAERISARNEVGDNSINDMNEHGNDLDSQSDMNDSESGSDETEPDSYSSVAPRSFFPCISDEDGLRNVMISLMNAAHHFPGDENRIHFIGKDPIVKYSACNTNNTDSSPFKWMERVVTLHTLHHGSVKVKVLDFSCLICIE